MVPQNSAFQRPIIQLPTWPRDPKGRAFLVEQSEKNMIESGAQFWAALIEQVKHKHTETWNMEHLEFPCLTMPKRPFVYLCPSHISDIVGRMESVLTSFLTLASCFPADVHRLLRLNLSTWLSVLGHRSPKILVRAYNKQLQFHCCYVWPLKS